MADIYDRAKASATKMLAPRSKGGKGLELSLIRVTAGEYDPEVGGGSETVEQFEGSGFRESYRLQDVDGSLIKQGDIRILISPVLLDGVDTPKPVSQDKVVFDGETYTVLHVDPWDYAGIVVGFSVQARK